MDITPPVITSFPPDQQVDFDPNITPTGSVTFPVVDAFDLGPVGGNPVNIVYASAPTGIVFQVDTAARMVTASNVPIGTTVVTATATDPSGNPTIHRFNIVGNSGKTCEF